MFRSLSDGWQKFWWGKGILPDRDNKVEDIILRIYNRTFSDYDDYRLNKCTDLLQSKTFRSENQTVLYIHGFIETAQQESVQVVVNSYLDSRPDVNVVLLDWSNMAHGSYLINAAPNTKTVGTAVAEQIKKMVNNGGLSPSNLHVIGHSLGSHVAGFIGRELKSHGITLSRITALDPAFPSFYPDGVMLSHITSSDADFVDVIHTDAGMYGAPVDTGHADFWPNGGKGTQPGCPRFAPMPLTDDNLCSHWRSWRFYAESVINPEAFAASPSDSYSKFKSNPNPEEGMVYMGSKCSPSARGKYFLTTNPAPPFGKGIDGIRNKKNHIIH